MPSQERAQQQWHAKLAACGARCPSLKVSDSLGGATFSGEPRFLHLEVPMSGSRPRNHACCPPASAQEVSHGNWPWLGKLGEAACCMLRICPRPSVQCSHAVSGYWVVHALGSTIQVAQVWPPGLPHQGQHWQ